MCQLSPSTHVRKEKQKNNPKGSLFPFNIIMKNIGTIITTYRKKAHLSQIDLADRLEEEGIALGSKAISAWEKGRSEPSAHVFLHVCRILGIPDCVEEYFGSNPNDPMSVLNDEGKQLVLSYIKLLTHPVNYAKRDAIASYGEAFPINKKMRELRLYDTRVSAGTGNFLDSDYYTTIELPAEHAGNADFAVTISGDSMEPEFHDHEMVLVHSQETLESGEIGIFSWNSNAYIKKFESSPRGTFLVSLNPKYKPIQVSPQEGDFRIFGKVCRTAQSCQ